MLDFSLTEEQEIVKESVREWCEKNIPLERINEFDKEEYIPWEVVEGMAEQGLLLPAIPEEHGGQGFDWLTACLISEEVGYADVTIAIPAGFQVVEGGWGFTVDRYCSEKIREEYIKPAINGGKFVGIATTEPGGGSDVAAFKSTAEKDGNEWIINGEKDFISGTEECKKQGGGYWINVRSGPAPEGAPHKNMTSFFLPIDADGVELTGPHRDAGRMSLSTGGFTMDDVRLSDEYRVGEKGKGFYYTMEGFDNARLLMSASAIGVTQRILDEAGEYIKQREAFGKPIAKYEGIQFEFVDLWEEMEATRLLIYKTAWMQQKRYEEEGLPEKTSESETFPPTEVSKWISMCKLKAPHLALEAAKKAMMWAGAAGYTDEFPFEMAWRGVMSYCVGAEGSTNIQRIVLGRELLGGEYVPYR